MENMRYLMMIEKSKTYNKMTKQVVTEHVENIRRLDDAGKLELCGVFKGYPGMAGMYILKTESREEAEEICRATGTTIICCKRTTARTISARFRAAQLANPPGRCATGQAPRCAPAARPCVPPASCPG